MKPATLAAVLSTMQPAGQVTKLLAGLAEPPASIEALQQKTPT
jgi:hypothetical protein